MLLMKSGDACILDVEDIVSWVSRELRAVDQDFSNRDKQAVREVVFEALDHWLDQNMFWTKRRAARPPRVYLSKLPPAIDRHDDPHGLVDRIFTHLAKQLGRIHDFPTWHIVHLQTRDTVVHLELDEDFRIREWMKDHWEEYECGKPIW